MISAGLSFFTIIIFFWLMSPYGLCWLVAVPAKLHLAGFVASILVLMFSMYLHYVVFINPGSSTAAIAFHFAPLSDVVLIIPVTILITLAISRLYRKFLGVNEKGFFVVQDFYIEGNQPFTDPYAIMTTECATQADFAARNVESPDLALTLPVNKHYIERDLNGEKLLEIAPQGGKPTGKWQSWAIS